ncbi:MAG: sugar phosphate nucleotidyltransferase [bacterium]
MGIYVFKKDILLDILINHCSQKDYDFGHHIIPPMIDQNEVYVYKFDDYWKDVGTLEAYWKTHAELIEPSPEIDLYDEDWKFYTRKEERPPVKFKNEGHAVKSLVANGSIINGTVENSVINKTIIDKEVEVMADCKIGTGDDMTPNQDKPELINNGLNIIAKRAKIPKGKNIKRNCRVFSYVKEDDFASKTIGSGNTIMSEIGKKIASGDEDQVRKINI